MKSHIEIPFFILLFAFVFSDPIITNLISYRTCYLTLSLNKTECARLGTKYHDDSISELEKKVQPYVAVLMMVKSLIEAFICSNICLFLGPWSDKFGRRPVLLFSLAGYTLAYTINTVITILPNVSPWFFLLSLIPICLSGGFPIILTATICYISDTTTTESRGVRMGIFEAITTLAYFVGNLTNQYIFDYYGYVSIYVITTCLIFLSWLFVFLAIPESVSEPQTDGKLRNLFKLSLITDTIKTTFKRRENFDRALLLTITLTIIVFLFATTADGGIVFLYLRNKLDWSLDKFTTFLSIRSVILATGSILGCYVLHKLLDVTETVIILLGFFSTLSSALIQGLATRDWHMYLAASTKCLGGVISPMTRSLVSKIVTAEETGRIFSFIVITETLVSLVGKPLYTFIYNKTLLIEPGIFNFITVAIYIFEIILIISVMVQQIYSKRQVSYPNLNYETLAEE